MNFIFFRIENRYIRIIVIFNNIYKVRKFKIFMKKGVLLVFLILLMINLVLAAMGMPNVISSGPCRPPGVLNARTLLCDCPDGRSVSTFVQCSSTSSNLNQVPNVIASSPCRPPGSYNKNTQKCDCPDGTSKYAIQGQCAEKITIVPTNINECNTDVDCQKNGDSGMVCDNKKCRVRYATKCNSNSDCIGGWYCKSGTCTMHSGAIFIEAPSQTNPVQSPSSQTSTIKKCITTDDCNKNVCFKGGCYNGACIFPKVGAPPPCANAEWKDYPTCKWDESKCNENTNVIVSTTCISPGSYNTYTKLCGCPDGTNVNPGEACKSEKITTNEVSSGASPTTSIVKCQSFICPPGSSRTSSASGTDTNGCPLYYCKTSDGKTVSPCANKPTCSSGTTLMSNGQDSKGCILYTCITPATTSELKDSVQDTSKPVCTKANADYNIYYWKYNNKLSVIECKGCEAVCQNIGTKSEGWYGMCGRISKGLIAYAECSLVSRDDQTSVDSSSQTNPAQPSNSICKKLTCSSNEIKKCKIKTFDSNGCKICKCFPGSLSNTKCFSLLKPSTWFGC